MNVECGFFSNLCADFLFLFSAGWVDVLTTLLVALLAGSCKILLSMAFAESCGRNCFLRTTGHLLIFLYKQNSILFSHMKGEGPR